MRSSERRNLLLAADEYKMDTPSKSVSAAVSIRPAESRDRGAIAELLSASKLVPLDETAQFGPQYVVAINRDGIVVGVAGYERYDTDILLRSVAACRSHGVRPGSAHASQRIGLPMPRDRGAPPPIC